MYDNTFVDQAPQWPSTNVTLPPVSFLYRSAAITITSFLLRGFTAGLNTVISALSFANALNSILPASNAIVTTLITFFINFLLFEKVHLLYHTFSMPRLGN